MRSSKWAARAVSKIENAERLDAPAAALNAAIRTVVRQGVVEDALSGTPIGHPLHPALVALPAGAWGSALALDLAGEDAAARRLIGLGLLAALPASASGASDWLTVDGAERRIGLVHALLNYAALGAFGASWWVRGRGRRRLGVGLSVAGATLVSTAGWLGGHLAYAQGVGVDTTAFQSLPAEWTDACSVDDLPAAGELEHVTVGAVPVLLARSGDRIVALADRCTHRGAPLDEGEIRDGCVVCPWHGSAFALTDGSVQHGPATRPQPVLETRVELGRVQVRRLEPRALRSRPVGP